MYCSSRWTHGEYDHIENGIQVHLTHSLPEELIAILIIIQRERLLVSQREKQKFNMEPTHLKKLDSNEARVKI